MPQATPCSPNAAAIGEADYQQTGRTQSGREPAKELFRLRDVLDHAGANDCLESDFWQVDGLRRADSKFYIECFGSLLPCRGNHGGRRIKPKYAKPLACEHQRNAPRPTPVVQDQTSRLNTLNGRGHEELASKVSPLLHAFIYCRCEPDSRILKDCRVRSRTGELRHSATRDARPYLSRQYASYRKTGVSALPRSCTINVFSFERIAGEFC